MDSSIVAKWTENTVEIPVEIHQYDDVRPYVATVHLDKVVIDINDTEDVYVNLRIFWRRGYVEPVNSSSLREFLNERRNFKMWMAVYDDGGAIRIQNCREAIHSNLHYEAIDSNLQ